MKAKRVYNNNVVLSQNKNGKELVLVGRGLAYGLNKGDNIDESKVEKRFELKETVNNKFKELIQDVPIDDILICEEVISYIKSNNDKEIDDSIYVTLTDHIINMVDRIKKGIDFDSTILLNISYLYKAEHKIALHAVEMLSKRYDLKIDDSEANFITLHIVNAESNSNMMEMYEITSIIDEILSIVNRNYKIDYEDFAYDRFITHCRFFVQRVVNKEYVEENKKKYVEMFLMMKGLYKSQYRCVNEIAHFIENKYNYQVEDDEKMYLLLHLVKLTT